MWSIRRRQAGSNGCSAHWTRAQVMPPHLAQALCVETVLATTTARNKCVSVTTSDTFSYTSMPRPSATTTARRCLGLRPTAPTPYLAVHSVLQAVIAEWLQADRTVLLETLVPRMPLDSRRARSTELEPLKQGLSGRRCVAANGCANAPVIGHSRTYRSPQRY